MSKFYTLSLADSTIIFTAAFEKKLNKGDSEAYRLYTAVKEMYPEFTVTVAKAVKRNGNYDHTSMADIEAYINDGKHNDWKAEFDKLFSEMVPSKTNAAKSVRKVQFAVIRKWFVEKRTMEEAGYTGKPTGRKTAKTTNSSKDAKASVNLLDTQVDERVQLEKAS